jgi:hypothetical protein
MNPLGRFRFQTSIDANVEFNRQVGLRTQIIAERDYTEPLRGSRSGLEDRMKIEIVHCPT